MKNISLRRGPRFVVRKSSIHGRGVFARRRIREDDVVVEYKGGHLYSAADAKEKRDIGKVWAAASGGRCLFAMVTDATTAGRSVATQLRGAMG